MTNGQNRSEQLFESNGLSKEYLEMENTSVKAGSFESLRSDSWPIIGYLFTPLMGSYGSNDFLRLPRNIIHSTFINNYGSGLCNSFSQVNLLNKRLSTSCPANYFTSDEFLGSTQQFDEFEQQFKENISNFDCQKGTQQRQHTATNILTNIFAILPKFFSPSKDDFPKSSIKKCEYTSSNLSMPFKVASSHLATLGTSHNVLDSKRPSQVQEKIFPSLLNTTESTSINNIGNTDLVTDTFQHNQKFSPKQLCERKLWDLIKSIASIINSASKLTYNKNLSETCVYEMKTIDELLSSLKLQLNYCENCSEESEICRNSLKVLQSMFFVEECEKINLSTKKPFDCQSLIDKRTTVESAESICKSCLETKTPNPPKSSIPSEDVHHESDLSQNMEKSQNALQLDRQRRKQQKTRKKLRRSRRRKCFRKRKMSDACSVNVTPISSLQMSEDDDDHIGTFERRDSDIGLEIVFIDDDNQSNAVNSVESETEDEDDSSVDSDDDCDFYSDSDEILLGNSLSVKNICSWFSQQKVPLSTHSEGKCESSSDHINQSVASSSVSNAVPIPQRKICFFSSFIPSTSCSIDSSNLETNSPPSIPMSPDIVLPLTAEESHKRELDEERSKLTQDRITAANVSWDLLPNEIVKDDNEKNGEDEPELFQFDLDMHDSSLTKSSAPANNSEKSTMKVIVFSL